MKLNKIEKLKLELKPIFYYEKLKNLKIDNITEADRFYLKNFGFYNTKLRPDKFMLRIRIPGGKIELEKLKKIVNLAKEYEAKIVLTSRAQIELHDLDLDCAIDIHYSLENSGITTFQTLTDNFRNIITDPLDGVGESNYFEVYPIILKMQKLFLKNKDFVGMIPRKFNTAISANKDNIVSFFANDCYFALAKKDNELGFNIYLGGKNIDVAKDADIFVKKDDVVNIYEAIIKAYQKYGLRENRTKARLYHLLQNVGLDGFKSMIQEFYNKELKTKGEPILGKKIHNDWHTLKNGRFAYRYKSRFGEIETAIFENIIKYCLKNGYEIRIGADQNLYILNLKEKIFPFKPLSQNQNIVVCAGEKYCIYSLFDTKDEASKLILDDINKYNIKIGYSGCLKGCERHILSDIGFVGIRTNLYKGVERGVRVYLGGLYTKEAFAARLIYWAVPLRKLNIVLKIIIDEFKNSGFLEFEEFSKKVLNGYSTEFLAFWFLYKLAYGKKIYLNKDGNSLLKKLNINTQELFSTIKTLEKKIYS